MKRWEWFNSILPFSQSLDEQLHEMLKEHFNMCLNLHEVDLEGIRESMKKWLEDEV